MKGDAMELLARWTGWFEARGFDRGLMTGADWSRGLCQCCLLYVPEQGHSFDCQYAMSKALLSEEVSL
uniref:Uncharacterized protein n=1 Tax=viral metagenome TaxID=1070528 RepID=A0A6M3KQC3_9ZZZZ